MDILDILCRLGLKLFTGEMGMDSFVVTIDRNTRTRTLDIKNEMSIAPIKNFVECTITGDMNRYVPASMYMIQLSSIRSSNLSTI